MKLTALYLSSINICNTCVVSYIYLNTNSQNITIDRLISTIVENKQMVFYIFIYICIISYISWTHSPLIIFQPNHTIHWFINILLILNPHSSKILFIINPYHKFHCFKSVLHQNTQIVLCLAQTQRWQT